MLYTKVINLIKDEVTIMIHDDEVNFQDIIPRKQFEQEYNIDFGDALDVIYEPVQNMFMVAKPGGDVQSYENPEDNEILSQIHRAADSIIDAAHQNFLVDRLPKFHVIENKQYKLPKENQAQYDFYKMQREAFTFLRETASLVLDSIETGQKLDPEIAKIREEARTFLGKDEVTRRFMDQAGLIPSPGSEAKIQAGIKEPLLDRLSFRPKNREKIDKK